MCVCVCVCGGGGGGSEIIIKKKSLGQGMSIYSSRHMEGGRSELFSFQKKKCLSFWGSALPRSPIALTVSVSIFQA